jgi:hypothetical protein
MISFRKVGTYGTLPELVEGVTAFVFTPAPRTFISHRTVLAIN